MLVQGGTAPNRVRKGDVQVALRAVAGRRQTGPSRLDFPDRHCADDEAGRGPTEPTSLRGGSGATPPPRKSEVPGGARGAGFLSERRPSRHAIGERLKA